MIGTKIPNGIRSQNTQVLSKTAVTKGGRQSTCLVRSSNASENLGDRPLIQMLSRFDLKPGVALVAFQASYKAFVALLASEGLIESSGPICQRLSDTPMDTDAANAQQFYSLMTFRDRAQLDVAYARFDASMSGHEPVFSAVRNATFTCWEKLP